MILVTGATGQLGTAVIETLLKKTSANQIAALVRDESKASALKEKGIDIRVGSYDDPASINKAMQGIEKVLLIAGTDEENRLWQHQNVVDAAKKAGVQYVAYTSRTLKDRNTITNKLMEGHFQTEDYIKECGLNYALFRNVLYMDTIPQFVGGEKVFETGINLPVDQGRVPFALRSEMGEAIVYALLKSDCSKDKYGKTPLSLVVVNGSKDMAELLIAKGADVNAKDNEGKTPLSLALQRRYDLLHQSDGERYSFYVRRLDEVARMLIARGADVNAKDKYGKTPLNRAIESGLMDMVELLVAKGADVNAKDKYGKTPLDRAIESNSKELVELLISKRSKSQH